MTHRRIILVALSVATVHFVLTSFIFYYAAYRVGKSAGENIAQFLIDAHESNGQASETSIDDRYQSMRKNVETTADSWQVTFVILSLPARFAIEPMTKPIIHGWYEQALSNELSLQQLRVRVFAIGAVENLLNSASFGFLVYLALGMAKHFHAP